MAATGGTQELLKAQHQELMQVLESWLTSQEERLSRLLASHGVAPSAEFLHALDEARMNDIEGFDDSPRKTNVGELALEDDSLVAMMNAETCVRAVTFGDKLSPTARRASSRDSVVSEHLQSLAKRREPTHQCKAIGMCEQIVRHSFFEPFFAVLIVGNSVITFVEAHLSLESPNEEIPLAFKLLGHLLGTAFLTELLLRITARRRAFFLTDSQLGWNYFDFCLVSTWLVEFVLDIIQSLRSMKSSSTNSGFSNMRLFRVLRIAKMFRLLRMARILRFVRALNILILSILTTLRSLVWASVLLLLIIFTFAIYICQNVANTIRDCDSGACAMDPELARYWGTVPTASLTLFQIISGGLNWDDVARPLMDLSGFLLVVLIMFIAFAQFAVLNVVTGVFCQAAVESAQRDRELMVHSMTAKKKQIIESMSDQFSHMFKKFSATYGGITPEAFEEYVNMKSVQDYFALLELDATDAWVLFQLLDEDGSGTIEVEEFVDGCLRLKGTARSIDLARLSKEFKLTTRQLQSDLMELQGQLKDVSKALDKRSLSAAAGWLSGSRSLAMHQGGRSWSKQSVARSGEVLL
eukprot:TRINITY_DN897_c0_g2_i1.p1 TRINITY_DN897_c0_g2~~TRINITY_DN897_c0_g2_i1.p1  ORF type:complete len:629 (-),score=92.04 TRINITY_DN897_c0_g2_i1:624-2366(-)